MKADYLKDLEKHLEKLPAHERADILRDQEEFFREAILSGRTENDVIGSLGSAKQLAKTLIAESRLAASENLMKSTSSTSSQVNSALRAFLALLALAPFNLIFVLGPFLGLLGVLFAAWLVGAVFVVLGIGSFFFIATQLTGLGTSLWAMISSVLLGVSITMFSVAFLTLLTWVTAIVAQGSVRYLRWNLDIIAERK